MSELLPTTDWDPAEGHPQRKAILAVLCVTLVLIVASVSSLNVAIPSIVSAVEASQSEQLWILDAYALVFAGLLLPAGALGDRFGRKGALQVGLAVFGLAAVYASTVDSPALLIGARGVMGVGAALIMPATLSIITVVFPPHERATAIATWAGFAGAGGAIGPLASGLLLERFWWGSVFFVNVPLVVASMLLVASIVPTSRDTHARPLDPTGALLSIVGLGALVFGIIEGPEKGWTSTLVLGAFAVAVLAIVAFVRWELVHRDPMLDPRLFRNRRFSIGSFTITASFAVMFGMFYVLTLYLQFVQGHSALGAAVRTLPFAATMIVVAPRAPRLVARFGPARTVAGGLLVQAVGFLLATRLEPDTAYPLIALVMVLLAAGMATLMPPSTEGIVSSLPQDKAGVGSAVNDTTRELGGAVGIALLGTLLSQGYRDGIRPVLDQVPAEAVGVVQDSVAGAMAVADRLPAEARTALVDTAHRAFTDGLAISFSVAALSSLLAAVVVLVFHPDRRPATDPDVQEEPAPV